MMSSLQLDSKRTDRTDVIQGIKVGERETSMSMKIPLPAIPGGNNASPRASAIEMKIVTHLWSALPAEMERVPALRELAGVMSSAASNFTGQDLLQAFSEMFPFGGTAMKKLMEEFTRDQSYPLRTEMEFTMPGVAEMMAQLNPAGATATALPSGPLMILTMELRDLSTSPIDDAVFQVPKDYQQVPLADLVKKQNK